MSLIIITVSDATSLIERGNKMESFNYYMPVKVYFKENCVSENLINELNEVGSTVMIAYGGGSIKRNGIYQEVISILKKANKNVVEFGGILSNPTYQKVQEGAALVREKKVDFILAVGGGSVIDAVRIIAVQAKSSKDIWQQQFVEKKIPDKGVPYGIVLTLAGTGSEMNNMAGITNEQLNRKTAVIGEYAKFTMMDPLYTMSVPRDQFLAGAFDSLSHCMETYFGKNDCLSDRINEAIMKSIIENIRLAVKNPNDVTPRSELIWASSLAIGGIVKSGKVGDFQCHSIEHQLCVYTNSNHGKALAILHPVVYRHIYQTNIDKFARFASEVWNVNNANKSKEELAVAGIQALSDFIKEIGLPTSFRQLGLDIDNKIIEKIADSTLISAGCSKQLEVSELVEILQECR